MIDIAKLREAFPADKISWRIGSTTADKSRGMALAYIDARDVQDKLDAVCGPENWQCRYPHAHDKKTVCEIGIKLGEEWVWKADGAGDTDVEAEKGALSDAFKRAAVRWGVGRYLYDLDSPWVEIEGAGRSYKIKEGEYRKLTALLGGVKQTSAPAPVPQKPEPTPADKKAAAIQFANRALADVPKLKTGADLADWWRENKPRIERVKEYDAGLFKTLTRAIDDKEASFNPVGA